MGTLLLLGKTMSNHQKAVSPAMRKHQIALSPAIAGAICSALLGGIRLYTGYLSRFDSAATILGP